MTSQSALRLIPQSLRRTAGTPHSAGFARLERGRFTTSSLLIIFPEFMNIGSEVARAWAAGRCA